MLSQQYRFHARGGVQYVYRHGRSVRGKLVSLTFMPNARGKTRLAVVVSKKVAKSAVSRNRIRRRVYAAIQPLLPELTGPLDAIFTIYSPEVLAVDFKDLTQTVRSLLTDARMLPH